MLKKKGGEKMKKIAVILIICIMCSFTASVVASAEEKNISPRLNNASSAKFDFSITDEDMAKIDALNENQYNPITGANPDNVTF